MNSSSGESIVRKRPLCGDRYDENSSATISSLRSLCAALRARHADFYADRNQDREPHVITNYNLDNELRAEYFNRGRRHRYVGSHASRMRFGDERSAQFYWHEYAEALVERKSADRQMRLDL